MPTCRHFAFRQIAWIALCQAAHSNRVVGTRKPSRNRAIPSEARGTAPAGRFGHDRSTGLPARHPPLAYSAPSGSAQACGAGTNDSRLRIEPRRVRFYESDGEVRHVTIVNERAIVVGASFAGEGQHWTDDVEFVLSRSGNDLSSGDITRHRCSD